MKQDMTQTVTQDMTQMVNKEIKQTSAKTARMVLTVLTILLTCGNIAAQTTATGVRVNGSVYGGGNEAGVGGNTVVNIETGTIANSGVDGAGVYGGCNTKGTVVGNATVVISGGTIGEGTVTDGVGTISKQANVHGGGQGQPTLVQGNVVVKIDKKNYSNEDKAGNAKIWGDVYGGSALGNVNAQNTGTDASPVYEYYGSSTTAVSLISGTVYGDVYGGGLGDNTSNPKVAANVYGPVTVTVDGGKAQNVFGCNNLYGTPKSTVAVTINSTAASTGSGATKTYALQGVYGGGNVAHYDPTTPSTYPTVTVYGCNTSIKDVYGGGNAAAVPYTNVTIYGGDIYRVFAGGNGETGTAANVGYLNSDENPSSGSYGTGTANATIAGGTINKVFGGSNSKGTVRASGMLSIAKSTADGACDMMIAEVYGGGNLAPGSASTITIGYTGDLVTGDNGHAKHPENVGTTLEGIGTVYGGANAAPITGNISLTINGGLIANVFGGNNTSGSVSGTIAVNIEKTCVDGRWYIGNVYGGGDQASYTGSPAVNIKNGIVSGNVYGGGNGDPDDADQVAGSTGAPTVTIGDITSGHEAYIATVLGDVYGGGNAAKVTGTTAPTVLVQKCNTQVGYVYGGGNAADVPATNVSVSGGTITGLFGGGHGDNTQGNEKTANVTGNVTMSVTGGTITQVFAGSNLNGSIGGTVTLEIDKDDDACDMKIREVYGGGNQAAGNAGTINIGCTGTIVTGENGHAAKPENIGVSLEGIGTVYGGANQANIGTSEHPSNITLNINSGMVANVFGGNNTSGTIYGNIEVNIEKTGTCGWYVGNVYGGGNLASYTGSPAVNIKNGTVSGNVYGGGKGESAIVTGNPIVTVGDLTSANSAYEAIVTGDVYGGGDAASVTGSTSVTLQKTNSSVGRLFGGGNAAGISVNTEISMTAGTVTTAVYGGCNTTGTVGGTSTVTVIGGTIGTAFASAPASIPQVVFGGGKGSGTSITGKVTLDIGTKSGETYTGSANIYGNVYGGSENGEVHAVDVNLYGNSIYGNVFGGGYRTAEGKTAATNVNIILDGTAFDMTYSDNGMAQIFGANDQVGSPTGHVLVHVKRTVALTGQTGNTYYLAAVYGGGNEADYKPTDTKKTTEVLIEGCSVTKIQNVYGGGNAAAVPASEVWIFGANIIGNVFGGGNGERGAAYAAHVGFHRISATEKSNSYETGGSGMTYVNLVGGTITNVYGGSNSNGDIRGGTNILMPQFGDYEENGGTATVTDENCALNTTNIFGGGKNALMSSGTNIVLGCMPNQWIDEIYAGAQAADVGGDVSLTITSGKFGRVFGGNKDSGKLMGSIKVNIEETGGCAVPIVIGELYAGGNQAGYSIYGYDGNGDPIQDEANKATGTPYANPQLNVRAFTSIGAIYGGGYNALMVGDPCIDINVAKGSHAGNAYSDGSYTPIGETNPLSYPAHNANEIGAIGNVFGGGNLANVIGNPAINIGTRSEIGFVKEPVHLRTDPTTAISKTDGFYVVPVQGANITGNVYGGGNAADIIGNATITIGTENLTGTGKFGTKIGGSVYGGGLGDNTKVTGSVEVNVGGDTGTGGSHNYVGYAEITGDVYGGSAKGKVNTTDGSTVTSSTTTTKVNLYGGTVTGSVYGGGYGKDDGTGTLYDANVYGPVTVDVYGGTAANVFGCNNEKGAPQGTVTVNINGTAAAGIGNVYGGGNLATYTYTTGNYPAVNIKNGKVNYNVYGGGKGDPNNATKGVVTGNPKVTIGDDVAEHAAVVAGDVYGGGDAAGVTGSTTVITSNTNSSATDLFGGGKGSTAAVTGNTTVTIGGGTFANVYGGGEEALTTGNTTVSTTGGTVTGNLHGGGNLANVTGSVTVLINGTSDTGIANVYGGGAKALTNTDQTNIGTTESPAYHSTTVTLQNGTVTGDVYGGGLGDDTHDANVLGSVTVNVSGGKAGRVFGANNVAGAPQGTVTVNVTGTAAGTDSAPYAIGSVFGGGNEADYAGTPDVNISGSSYVGNVYGGGNDAAVAGSDVAISTDNSTSKIDKVFGGGNQAGTSGTGDAVVNVSSGKILSAVYGGCNASGTIGGDASVTLTGGTIGTEGTNTKANVHGGGFGSSTYVKGNVTVQIGNMNQTTAGATIWGDVYGGSAEGHVNAQANTVASATEPTYITTSKTKVSLYAGTINGDAYGGGLGAAGKPAYVGGDVTVELNGTTNASNVVTIVDDDKRGCVVNRIFGCNNINGSPKGEVTVHVYATQSASKNDISTKAKLKTEEETSEKPFDVQDIYGGGNVAEYYPTMTGTQTEDSHIHTNVIIDGCELTSIKRVFGGGNAASTPSTKVTVNGTYEINEVFGGGNGEGTGPTDMSQPAHVGYHHYTDEADKDDSMYGFGKAEVIIGGGTINTVYGASNQNGNVREVAIATLDNVGDCELNVGNAYGGGKLAPIDGRAILNLGCVKDVGDVYGGAENADVHNDIELNITNGTYNNVYGGNNIGGKIFGTITVNIVETGCTPININKLFGGGRGAGAVYDVDDIPNDAAHSHLNRTNPASEDYYRNFPKINVISATSIGNIYGGGDEAKVIGNPVINIMQSKGRKDTDGDGFINDAGGYAVADNLGTIGNIYGGGNNADVDGNVTVNIATQEQVDQTWLPKVGGAYQKLDVEGANITGSVYGGGFGAKTTVTGNVEVNIGGEKVSGGTTTYIGGTINIAGSVYGGSALGAVNASTTKDATTGNITAYTPTADATTTVTLKKGTVSTAVFGGGMGNSTDGVQAKVYGKGIVNFYGDVISGGLYGGCDAYGTMFNGTELNLMGGRIGTAYTTVPATGIPEIVFGGGLGALTVVQGAVNVNVGKSAAEPGSCTIYSNVYGGSKNGSVAVANVNLYGGTIYGNVFGGGYSTDANATAATDVTVTLNGTKFPYVYSGTGANAELKTSRIFGCNNLQGSPTGIVKVDVFKTVGVTGINERSTDKSNSTFDLYAVYGGGNKADYTANGKTAQVVIETCDVSINEVYGGGYGADVPKTLVDVKGAYEIGTVFGGGYGAGSDDPTAADYNPGANVKGVTEVFLRGGTIHEAYGGSNTKGNISGGTNVNVDNNGGVCDLNVGKVYGAGKNARMEGSANVILGCQPDAIIEEVYGGAESADIDGSVELTVTSGHYRNVFGGNKTSGVIKGSIRLNIEESRDCGTPLIIDHLYGCGNQAPYSVYGYKAGGTPRTKAEFDAMTADEKAAEHLPYADPEVHVISFTQIGQVFGGGLGANAKVYGNPKVFINQRPNYKTETATAEGADKHVLGTIGAFTYGTPAVNVDGGVYGGGSEANVYGNTTVFIGSKNQVEMHSLPKESDDEGATWHYPLKYVEGANINGNVYGGGLKADVSGNTEVVIGADKVKNTDDTYSYPAITFTGTDAAEVAKYKGIVITGDVFGAGKGVETDYTAAMVRGNSTVNMAGGAVKGNIYGGGELASVGDFTYNDAADVLYVITGCTANTGTSTVNIMGGSVGDVSEYKYNPTDAEKAALPNTVFDANNRLSRTKGGNVFAGSKGELKKSDNTYLTNWLKFARVNNTVLNVSGGTIMSNIFGGGEIGLVGYKNSSNALVGSTMVTVSGGIIGTEIKDTDNKTQYTFGSVFGGGFGSNEEKATDDDDTHAPKLCAGRIYGSTSVEMTGGEVKASVYGGGQLASVGASGIGGNAVVTVSGGTIGIDKDGDKMFGGATMGNVYGGGSGDRSIVRAGQIFGNTTVTVSEADHDNNPTTIYHNIYGGGAYGSVGDFKYIMTTETTGQYANIAKVDGINSETPLLTAGTGTTSVTVTGGTIGVDGKENGMVFGSSRGDVGTNRDKWQAWVYKTNVVIGDETAHTGPDIMGSVYGSGENGHVYTDTDVKIHGGVIGIYDANDVVKDGNGKVTKDYNTTRGNVYGGGCGEDTYPADTEVAGMAGKYEPSAGIVYGDTKVTMTGGTVKHNIYGAGALGSVGKMTTDANGKITFDSGGTTIIAISGGIVGVDGNGNGNVFGAARGDSISTQPGIALVKTTNVTINGTTTGTNIWGSVYGGGQTGDVGSYTTSADGTNTYTTTTVGTKTYSTGACAVTVNGGRIHHNVYGAGKGVANTFTCQKAMVDSTLVTITNGIIDGSVYGGGEVGRVERNTVVKIGDGDGVESGDPTSAPEIKGNVFGAGAGLETHGYSALVRGNSKVTIEGNAKVRKNVYGGGEKATVGKYWVTGVNYPAALNAPTPPSGMPSGMPYATRGGGLSTVTIRGYATIGPDSGDGTETEGQVFGAGKGVNPHYNNTVGASDRSSRMNDADTYEYFATEAKYFEFLETLALVSNTEVTISGNAKVKASVFGGSESGFVQDHTHVTIQDNVVVGTATTDTYGNVFAGGKGLSAFAEAGRVRGNTKVDFNGGEAYGSVYGGGKLGDVGTIDKTDINGYVWSGYDDTDTSNDTGVCTVSVIGGTVHKNVFGAGKGEATTFECEKAMAYSTDVTIDTNAKVNGNVYGGGEVGRVENNTVVKIGSGAGAATGGTSNPVVGGNVFGAGAGLETHGYSALVRGNSFVTVEGNAKVGKNVYGGGEKATVGKYWVTGVNYPAALNAPTPPALPDGMPYATRDGGICTVIVQGFAQIGPDAGGSNNAGHVFGAGKGVEPSYSAGVSKRVKTGNAWESFSGATGEADYLRFLETLALVSVTNVTIDGNAKVKGSVYGGSESGFVQDDASVTIKNGEIGTTTYGNVYGSGRGLSDFAEAGRVKGGTTVAVDGGTMHGSVYGGGELGIVTGAVLVNINNGTVEKDVYGGGALANTNTNNWDGTTLTETYLEVGGLIAGTSPVAGYYTKSGDNYTLHTSGPAAGGTKYYRKVNTTVNLLGGTIKGDAYGGGLGQLGANPIEAKVYGDVFVTLGDAAATKATAFDITKYDGKDVVKSGRVFGCNNLNGSPKGNVTVTVNKTVTTASGVKRTPEDPNNTGRPPMGEGVTVARSYELAAVYGGGNLADYEAEGTGRKTNVIINSCDVSINQVYGGGNAAKVPETDVLVNGAYEIHQVFGGGNGADMYTLDNGATWKVNPGANIDGNANTLMKGGYIHEAYGGSNEKGTITGNITIDTGTGGLAACPVQVDKLVGAGKNADVNGNLIIILGCKDNTKIPIVYGGADNANVNGNVELTITSGRFGQVFGGNNLGGVIKGHIYLNIEETSDCEPIRIDDLYLGGNQAAYSRYGYYVETNDTKDGGSGVGAITETPVLSDGGKLILKPRTSADDRRKPVKNYSFDEDANKWTWEVYPETGDDAFKPYEQPVLNVTSCTSIGRVFGGGLGEGAAMYADPTVNINMIPGKHAEAQLGGEHKLGQIGIGYTDTNNQRIEGGVFGGGNEAAVYGNTTVNIGTEKTVKLHLSVVDANTGEYTMSEAKNVEGANILSNVYGGGNEADVTGNTYVNVCAYKADDTSTADVIEYKGVTISGTDYEGVTIKGNVFGGGKGIANTFKCDKAMVGVVDTNDGKVAITKESTDKGTRVSIGNGTVNGTVYGGGEVGRVEWNTVVTIGLPVESGKSEPVVKGYVFGAGKGVEPYGYAALVRGNTFVTIQEDAKVGQSVYGGGEIASVGKYSIASAEYAASHPEIEEGMPYSLANQGSGYCNVIVRGNAEIGPDNMVMAPVPTDKGHVFGGGKGVLPYENLATIECQTHAGQHHPGRMAPGNVWECYDGNEAKYLSFVETQALTTQTDVTIGGNAFVKGSVYGGSENGHVQHDTHVTIAGDSQIGAGYDTSTKKSLPKYTGWPTETENITTSWKECAHWDYDPDDVAPWDPYATYKNPADGKYYYDAAFTQTAEGGFHIAKDGHTFYGNVFGGGSGVIPYAPGKWHRAAGSVGGNTVVDITGGHILTSVYGGNEQTDVGTYKKDDNGALVIPVRDGKCTINMTGGTVGVPRTEADMKNYPLTCYVFGAGKGDPRIFFNTWTNVIETEVNISGDARIYGSTFGGGEDGHVIGNAATNISGAGVIIGTTGTSYVDGNVFGGGRGFTGEAQTAGTVGGNVDVNISNGKILGSVYGGGRLASVGTQFTAPSDPNYGTFEEDGDGKTYGQVTINVSGGTIGNGTGRALKAGADGRIVSGNVFGGSMGRLTLLDGTTNPIWPQMAQVKNTAVNIYGNAIVKRNVYGGGELGTVRDNAAVTIGGILNADSTINVKGGGTVNRDVYGGGYGSEDFTTKTKIKVKMLKEGATSPYSASDYDELSYVFTPMIFAGDVGQNTYVNIAGGKVRKSVYGGGEMASVGILDCRVKVDNNATDPVYTEGTDKYVYEHFHSHLDETNGFALSWPFHFENAPGYFGATHVKVTGGRIGVANGDDDINTDNGDVYGGGKGIAGLYKNYVYCANVGLAEVTIDYPAGNTATPQNYMTSDAIECIAGAVYGGAENGHVMGDTKLMLKNGLIGHSIYGGGSGKGKFTNNLKKIAGVTVKTNNAPTTAAKAPTQYANGTYDADIYSITAGKVFGNTEVEMTGGYVVRNVYGGGNLGSVGKGNYAGGTDDYSYYNGARLYSGYGETLNGNLWDNVSDPSKAFLSSGKSIVTITGGTVGYIDPTDPSKSMYSGLPYGNVFGGCRGESAPNIGESPRYLYCPTFFSGYVNETHVTIGTEGSSTGPKILASVYGGGMDGHVRRDATVTINSGEIGRAYTGDGSAADLAKVEWLNCGNVYGAGSGTGQYKYDFNYDGDYEDVVEYTNPETGRASTVKETDFSTSAGSVTRFTTVNINGGTIHRNVYGGGSLSSVGAPKIPPTRPDDPIRRNDDDKSTQGLQSLNKVVVSGGHIGDAAGVAKGYGGKVVGGSRGELSNDDSFSTAIWTDVTVNGNADIKGSVFGGGEAGMVKHDTEVKMQGGTVGTDLYGGGDMADVKGSTTVTLTGGKVVRDVFGGARGTKDIAANVGGDVLVELNCGADPANKAEVDGTKKGAIVKGNVFGANNVNGTPKGHVVVHVYATQNENMPDIKSKIDNKYDVAGVYGGGKQSDYVPEEAEAKQSTEVIIEGCDLTSIEEVYGGGYGAATPATNVLIKGTKIINNVYGGGYGKSTADFPNNPGANVGYLSDGKTSYGNAGKAVIQLMAGKVNNVYGGSNTKGDIRGGSNVTNVANDNGAGCCDRLTVGEIYGGGKSAPMYGGAEIVLGCMPNDWIGAIYAGAEDADVGNDVSLTLTSGKFGRVFGGNNKGGKIDGSIEVNIEENPDCDTPLVIGELYGGGNQAAYETPARYFTADYPDYQSPRVNVRAFTSIGNVFGGGFGDKAKVKGNPLVNINEVYVADADGKLVSKAYDPADETSMPELIDGTNVKLYKREAGKMGVIGTVFGGGNAAPVEGKTFVNIATEAYEKLANIVVGETDVDNYYTRSDSKPYVYTKASGKAAANTVYYMPVLGADIRGNVYGGGNNAEVTGKTNVVIGEEK